MTGKNIKRVFLTAFLGLIILMVLPFGKLILTDGNVAKSFLFDIYFVKVSSNQNEFDVLSKYMNGKGWNKAYQLGGLYIFEKDGLKKHVSNTQVKVLLIDGKLNLDY